MKKKINHILPALVLTASLGLTTVSCNGFLDEMPDNRTELNTDQKPLARHQGRISGHAQFSLGRLLQRNSRRQYGAQCHRRKRKSGVTRPTER